MTRGERAEGDGVAVSETRVEPRISEWAREVLELEGAAVIQLKSRIDRSFEAAVQTLAKVKGQVLTLGVGKSGLVAKKIAAAIRHSSGGYRFVKAAGFTLEDRGIVQVSMNLTNYEKTPIYRVFETVRREASRYGVAILESEIVGLVPSAALLGAAEYYLQIQGFKPNQVLENKLREEPANPKSDF